MKEIYLDIMEKALSAYTDKKITEYTDEVKRVGLTEHGFPRLGANIGILMAHGRRLELKGVFIEIIDLCLHGFAHPINSKKAGNNFAVREVCHMLAELEKTNVIDREQLEVWKKQLATLDIPTTYTHIVSEEKPNPHNWAYFAVVSEQARCGLCGMDATAFLEHQLPSQLARLDENGMYRDQSISGAHQPLLYDLMTRVILGLSLHFGYSGKYSEKIEKMMEISDDLTLKTQSVTGEIPFGGRSNQCLFNETVLASYCELRASLLYKSGDFKKAALFKAAAEKATASVLNWLDAKPMCHVKNHFDPDLQLGCEGYAYFNKYMITVASNAYLAFLVAKDEIEPADAVTDIGGYIALTSNDFHKAFLNCGGYFLEFDLNADTDYDANGLGRIQKCGCDPVICLSVPFPDKNAHYSLLSPNIHPLSICSFKNTLNGIMVSSGNETTRSLVSREESNEKCSATFGCTYNKDWQFTEKFTVSKSGVDIESFGADGILVPVFRFDGANETEITTKKGEILVKYNGSFCKYTFFGEAESYGDFSNRNGNYHAFKINSDKLHIEIGETNEL